MIDDGLPMTFYEYELVFDKTAIYPDVGNNIIYPAFGLCGESGEIAEKLKKIIRDKDGEMGEDDIIELRKELGDVLWYLSAMAHELGTTLEEVAEINREKLLSRLDRGKLQGSGDNR